MSRSRRGGGAFGGGGGDVEVGQAERENDAMSAALSDRIATLKGITQGLHDESESQVRERASERAHGRAHARTRARRAAGRACAADPLGRRLTGAALRSPLVCP